MQLSASHFYHNEKRTQIWLIKRIFADFKFRFSEIRADLQDPLDSCSFLITGHLPSAWSSARQVGETGKLMIRMQLIAFRFDLAPLLNPF
jgi:hypothetical protein